MAQKPSLIMLNKYLLPSFGEMKLAGSASSYVYLYYLIFMKKLSNAAHGEAFKRKCISVTADDVAQASKKLCREFSLRHNMSQMHSRGSRRSTSSEPSKKESKMPVDRVQNPGVKSKIKKPSHPIIKAKPKLAVSHKARSNKFKVQHEMDSISEESSQISLTMSENGSASVSSDSDSDMS